jgi:acyl carrier protein
MVDAADLRTARMTAHERLIVLVRQILGPPAASRPLPIDARLSDLGLSSLKMVSLMLAIEVQFDIAIPAREVNPDNFKSITTVDAMIARLVGPGTDQE